MKKLVLILTLSSLFSVGFAENNLRSNPKKPFTISFSLEIASKHYNCDSHFGICKVSGEFGRIGGDGRNVSGECYIENGILSMTIFRKYVSDEFQRELDATTYFSTDEDNDVPSVWIDKLGLKGSYTIPKGNYRIIKYDDVYEINFELQ